MLQPFPSLPGMPTSERPGPDRPSRRTFLAGGLGALSLFWSDWLRAATGRVHRAGKAQAVILIFNAGAPSHLDLWDMKPDAPDVVRGPFRPLQTRTPGLIVSELMPRLALRSDRYAVIRTVHHRHGAHNAGMHWSIVGRPYPRDETRINPSRHDLPCFGTLVGWLARRDGYTGRLPPYVITPAPHCDSKVYLTPGQFGGCLGASYDPFVLNSDPNAPAFQVPNLSLAAEVSAQRLRQRRSLLGRLDDSVASGAGSLAQEYSINQDRAFELVTSPEVQRAFDLSREPAQVRDRYGRHTWGQSHLLARRLVEAGVRFVTTVNGPSIVWDTHKANFVRLKDRLVPPMEQAFAALLDDLAERGLLDRTLVVWMGDFGRTPTINKDAGRDHWPACYSMVLAGGGIHGGQVIGESDRIGGHPKDNPVTPADVHATVFTALGYDSQATTYLSPEGRPFPLSDGQPIRGLL
jgi:hypothetical protein